MYKQIALEEFFLTIQHSCNYVNVNDKKMKATKQRKSASKHMYIFTFKKNYVYTNFRVEWYVFH